MSARGSVARRRSSGALATLLLMVCACLLDAPGAHAAGAPAATSTTLQVLPTSSATVETPLTFAARVSPSDAAGYVRFTGDGRILASADVVDGTATTGVVHLPVGPLEIVATFVPYDPGAYATSQSPAAPLTVAGVPSVWVATASGALVPGSAPVETGRTYTIHVSGFPASAQVVVRMGAQTLAPGIRADAAGSGSLPVLLPAGLAPGVYTVDASSGAAESQAVFYVIPPGGPATTTAPATTVPSATAVPPGTAPSSEPQGALAHTGADPLLPLASGLALLLVGGLLLAAAGDPHAYRPRH